MNTYTLYNVSTGMLTGRVISCPNTALDLNVPDGYGVICGVWDYLQYRVDLTTGALVEYIPNQPSKNHVWNENTKRWVYIESDEDISKNVRSTRARLIAESDWTQVNDSPLSSDVKTAWAGYRQALRDVTKQQGFPRNIIWPTKPEGK